MALAETGKRPERGEDWLEQELRAMHEEVNRFRLAAQLEPVDLEAIRQADRTAEGSDYLQKLTLYCTDIATDQWDIRP
ncbi:hypothetical protein [Streptomyces sp. 5-10]|uniref:hypothetical protein n=1 Tax=Streptomyces sp. 5-10 TaxID=878925 RepID=UPI00168BCDB6|nr:hypothetical protein [Streptomyces sp. 5-10]MBD3004737.1 hypothetical protein [Streptomyces sp. 5-10]